ncbi:MAG: ABC transporter permease [Planctomycetota bacterium]|nr:ABC transporter permease [Planctomycetota bacterium]
MRTFLIDLKYAVRMIVTNPGFALVAVISLALGIGANTTIFSIVNTLLLKPLPVEEPSGLVSIFNKGLSENEKFNSNSYPEYLDMNARDTVFDGVACASFSPLGFKGKEGDSSVLLGQQCSANFFRVLGIQTILGRDFLPEEGETEGTHPVVLISEKLWQGQLGGNEDIIGQSLLLNGYPFTVVGVIPKSFEGLNIGIAPQIWAPLMMHAQLSPFRITLEERGNNYLRCIARLKPGVTIEQAKADMAIFANDLSVAYPDVEEYCAYTIIPANDDRIMVNMTGGKSIAGLMIVLMSVVGLVLLIACSNVASILLARASGRQKEIAIRLAMGAGRGRIIRQLLTESTLLALIAGGAGIALASWTIGLIQSIDVPYLGEFPVDFTLDNTVLFFTVGIAVLTGLIFGLAPALQVLRPDIVPALKDQGKSVSQTAGKSRLQNMLVVAQVSLSLFMLITAGMFIRSLQNAEQLDMGFDPDHCAVLSINLGMSQYEEEQGKRFYDDLLQRVREQPGVIAAGYATTIPFGLNNSSSDVSIPGYETAEGEGMSVNRIVASDGYFKAMGIPMLSGRGFDTTDDEDGEPVIVINQFMADRFFADREALGGLVRVQGIDRRIVGITKTGLYRSLSESPLRVMYIPHAQKYEIWQNLHIRTEQNAEAMLGPAVKIVNDLDSSLPIFSVATMEHNMGFALLPARIIGTLVGMFGFIALVLSITGIYGVMAYSVSQRTNEFGIRMAIGAQQGDVLKLVLKKGLIITGIGMALGLGIALAVGWLLTGFLHGVSAVDPLIFATVVVVLFSVAVIACLIPARRAMRVDPMTALRYE